MKHLLLLLLRNATKHNSIKFSAVRLHVSADKFWNCLKDLKCNNVKNSCLLVNTRTLCSTKLKKNMCKTFYRLKCKEFRKNSQKSTHLLRCMKCMSHVGYWNITIHFIFFFNHPTSTKSSLFLEQFETDCLNHCAVRCLTDWTFVWEK